MMIRMSPLFSFPRSPRYGLYDPLKGEQKDLPVGTSGGTEGGTAGGLRGGVGGGGLPATFSPPKLTGVGDKGAG